MNWILEAIIKFWLQWALGLLAGLIGLVYRRVLLIKKKEDEREKETEKQNKAMRDAMVSLLRDRIFQSCRLHLKNGEVATTDLEVLNALYQAYHALGGDSLATTLVERVNKLKIIIEDVH